jgi:DNA-binding transcriptional LysR family regulator
MDLQQLVTFRTVVEEGNFSRAGWAQGLTQPAVSSRILSLERELGGSLFVRGGRQLRLTELGEQFYSYASRALEVLNEGIEAAERTRKGRLGLIRIGVLESLLSYLASAVSAYRRQSPDVSFFVRTGHSEDIIKMLRDRRVSLGFVIGSFAGEEFDVLARIKEPVVFAASASNPLSSRGQLSLDEIAVSGQILSFARWDASALPEKIASKLGATADLPVGMVRELIMRGTGAAILSRSLIEADIERGDIVELEVEDLPGLRRESALVCLKAERPLPASVRTFLATLRGSSSSVELIDEKMPAGAQRD